MIRVKAGLTVLAAVGIASSLVACRAEPAGAPREAQVNSITVSADRDRYQQIVLGEVLVSAFNRRGREAQLDKEISATDQSLISRLDSGNADLVLGCTGTFLAELDPALAEELSKEYLKEKAAGLDPNDGTWRDRVYEEMVGSLPSSLMATDPSNATGCQNSDGPELPQNVVPVFRESALVREDRLILNQVSGGISTDDLEDLFKEDRTREAMTKRIDALLAKLQF